MELSPRLYHWIVRPQWLSNLYINDLIEENFNFANKQVLDFGCGIGSSCLLCPPENYLGLDPDQERINYACNLYPDYEFQVLKEENNFNLKPNSFDYILIVAVLHHIPKDQLSEILQEFHQVLKPDGEIIAIEPCFLTDCSLKNYFMDLVDNGDYIRTKDEYFKIFSQHEYEVNLIKKYRKLFFYNELFFAAYH